MHNGAKKGPYTSFAPRPYTSFAPWPYTSFSHLQLGICQPGGVFFDLGSHVGGGVLLPLNTYEPALFLR